MPSSTSSFAIGIDLGTTYCCVAFLRHPTDKPEVIQSNVGKNTTPSFVGYDFDTDDEDDGKGNRAEEIHVYAGQAAHDLASHYPENTIFDMKRLIGRHYYDPKIQKYKKLWPFHLVNVHGFVGVKLGDKNLLPQVIAKELIARLKEDAEKFLGCAIDSAVVTVPVYYSEMQTGLTRAACEEAGFTSVHFIPEPVSAAIAYGLHTSTESHETKTCLIYDLGGGTFDVTVFRLGANRQVEIVATGGDDRLGGEDFNDLIMEYCISEFQRINNINLFEGRTSDDANVRKKTSKMLRRIRRDSEEKKCHLSTTRKVFVSLECVHENTAMNVKVTREIFENLIHDLLTKSIKILDETIKKCGIEKSGIDEVILIGGSTRIPKAQQMVEEYFKGKRLLRSVDVDGAVACGAAIHAHNIFKENGAPLSIVTLKEKTPVETRSVSRVHRQETDVPSLLPKTTLVVTGYVSAAHRQEAVALNVLPKKMRWSNQVHGFPPRSGHAAVAVENRVYSFGGWNGSGHTTYLEDGPLDAFVLNVNEAGMEWRPLSVANKEFNPRQRLFHSAVAHKEFVIIFGGEEAKSFAKLNTTFRFNTQTLKWDSPEVTGNIPNARCVHSAVVIGNQMLVFGGKNNKIKVSNDLYSLDLDTFQWSKITTKGTAPSFRRRHSATVYKDRFMFIFGGWDPETETRLNDLFCFDVITNKWTCPETSGTTPPSRQGHSAFMHNGHIFVFGGYNNQNSCLNDICCYTPETGEWKEVNPTGQPPSPRMNFGCVALNDGVFVFGGDEGTYSNGTFILKSE